MNDNRAIADARIFFRRVVYDRWGHLIRKRKERTAREQTIREVQLIYWQGIRRAWEIYTKDDMIVKQAYEALGKAISQAHELYLKDEEEMSDKAYARANKLFVKAIRQAHDDYAETVAQVWRAFIKDMKKEY